MSQHDYVIANNTGLAVRTDINAALAAIVSGNSGDTAPATTFPFMFWVDTSGTDAILKMRNEADNAWLELITLSAEIALSAGGVPLLSVDASEGVIKLLSTKATVLPIGTTAQRPGGTPTGYIRYNTDLLQFEGYANGAWVNLSAYTGYAAIVGSGAFCTHATLAAALADSAVAAGSSILVTSSATINSTISVAKANISIEFAPGVTYTNGSAGTGITIDAAGVRIKGGRFSGFTSAITITSTFNFNFVTECRFVSCTAEVTESDSAPNNVILMNISE